MVNKISSSRTLPFKPFNKDAIVEIESKNNDLKDPTLKKFDEFVFSGNLDRIFHMGKANVYAGTTIHSNIKRNLCNLATKHGIKCGMATVKYKIRIQLAYSMYLI